MPFSPESIWAVALVTATMTVGAGLWLFRRRRAVRHVTMPVPAPAPAPATALSAGAVLRVSLASTRRGLVERLQGAWTGGRDVDARLAALEEVLLTADVGVKATQELLAMLRPRARNLADAAALRAALRDDMVAILTSARRESASAQPHVVLVAGVNGVGKTTTIGKLARFYARSGKTVLLVAADTFRAAAAEQLGRWAERVGVSCVRHQAGADPSAVAFDGLKAGIARGVDVVIIDTAGRLHVKTHLIEELKKIVRVVARQVEGAPHEALLVIDATTGQNAITQARVFSEAVRLTGVVLTKLDGTAKGGVVLAIRSELGIPIEYIGFGEGVDHLAPFDAASFVDALLLTEDVVRPAGTPP